MSLYRTSIVSLLSCCILIVTACGFTPVYKQSSDVSNKLASIDVIISKSRNLIDEQILIGTPEKFRSDFNNKLADLLNPSDIEVEKEYLLTISLARGQSQLAVQRDGTITRYKISVSADIALTDLKTKKIILKEKLARDAEYDQVTSDYSTYVSRKDAEDRAVTSLVEDIQVFVTSGLY